MKKLITFLLFLVLALSCCITVTVASFADAENETTGLEITSLTATDNFNGWQMQANYVSLGAVAGVADWTQQDGKYFVYVDAQGNDKFNNAMYVAGYLTINHQQSAPVKGDVISILKGYTYPDNRVLGQDVAFEYDGTAWVTGTVKRYALSISGLTAIESFYGAGMGTYVWLGENGEADWTAQDSNYFSYINAAGKNILGRVVSYNQHLVINFQSAMAADGDIITIKKGYIWANKELKEDISFKYNGTTSAWEVYSATKPDEPETLVELAALEINGLTAIESFYGAGSANYVFLGEGGPADWTDQDSTYFSYVNSDNENKLGRVTVYQNNLIINFVYGGSTITALEGDIVTIKKGFVWGNKELKEDVVFEFYKGVWMKGGAPEDIAIGNVWDASNNCFAIYLTDSEQIFTTAGWIGSDTTFAFYYKDWGHDYVNDISKVYFVNGADKYSVTNLQYYTGEDFRVLQVYFDGCDFATAKKGDMVCFEEDFFVNTNANPVYTFGEKGSYYCFDGSSWSKVALATDARISVDASVTIGATAKIECAFAQGTAAPVVSYTSSAEDVATVANGVIKGIAEGTAQITVNFKGFSKTFDISVEKALEPTSLAVEITDEIFNENGSLVAYAGESLDKNKLAGILQVKYVYENGAFGIPFSIKPDNISLDNYNNGAAGTSTISVTYGDLTATLNVKVYEITKVNAPAVNNLDFWSTAISLQYLVQDADFNNVNWQITDENILLKLGVSETVELKSASKNGGKTFKLSSINYLYSRDIAFGFEGRDKNQLEKGDVLTFKKGLRMYKRVGTAYVALFELSSDFKVVWTGSDWVDFVAEAERVELSKTEISLPVGSYQKIPYSTMPAGSYIKAVITSSNPEAVAISDDGTAIRVLKKSDTPVEVTIQLGEDASTKKTIRVTVSELDVTGFEIYEKREYNVSLGADLKLEYYYNDETTPKKLYAVTVFSDGSTGEPFALNLDASKGEVNTVIGGYDKNKVGSQNVTLTITKDGKEFDTSIVVNVKDSVAQVPDMLMQNPFGVAPLKFYISFAKTAKNEINIPQNISDAYEIEKYIKFVRGANEFSVEAVFNGQFLVINAVFTDAVAEADRVYKLGDKFIVSKGLPILQWMGDSSNYNAIGAGDYVVAGTVEYEIVFEHSDPVSKSWNTYIQYVGIELADEIVEIGFGKLKDLGATMIPAYATVGKFTIVSSDPAIASVNANGLVKGEKIGTTTLTVTLSGGTNGDIVRTVTVKVVDVVSGIKFNKDTIYVDKGTVSLNGQIFKDKGVEGVLVWSSGKEEGTVDFTNAKFVGYSANKEGEQIVTVRLTIDGVSTTGKITVIIGKEPQKGCGGGCGSLVGAQSAILALIAFAGVAILRKKR